MSMKRQLFLSITVLGVLLAGAFTAAGKKKSHPFDLYDHDGHNKRFEAASFSCDNCHVGADSYNREKVSKLGCHICHNNPKPPVSATNECSMCHPDGPPKPESHKVNWLEKHQAYAKQNPDGCKQCHSNQMFCMDCHQRRDTVQEKVHRRNFRFSHSITARANPRRCATCHTVNFCQDCHTTGGDSKR